VSRLTRIDRTAFALVLAFFVFLLWFGVRYHPIEETGSAEIDNYIGKADEILAGTLPRDGFHPLLYPLTVAGVAAITHHTFASGRAISSLFAALLVLATYLLGCEVFDRRAAWFALVAMMLNPLVITMGVHTTTDMMFASLAAWTLYAAIRANRNPTPGAVAGTAVLFAAAYFTRGTGIMLIPVVLAALTWTAAPNDARRVVTRIAVFAAVAIVCLIPHFVLTARAFGSPFHNDNWRNVAFKLYGNWDWDYLMGSSEGSTLKVIMRSPLRFVTAAAHEQVKFFYDTLITLGGYGIAGGLFAAASLGGAYTTALAMDRSRALVLSFLGFYILLVSLFFYTGQRFMFPVVPVCYLLCGAFIAAGVFQGTFTVRGRAFRRAAPVVAVFMLALAATSAHEIRQFIARHPLTELRAAQEVEKEYGKNITILGTSPFSHRGIDCEYIHLNRFITRVGNPSQPFYERLRLAIEEAHVDYVIVGKQTLGGIPIGMLTGEGVPAYLQPIMKSDDVVVYRVLPLPPAP